MDELERRKRIYQLMEGDPQYKELKAEYDRAEARFTKLTNHLPQKLRNLFWSYPGMGHILHHRMLNIICETMCFPDES